MSDNQSPRHPQQEARARLEDRWDVRVLEPSPPADQRPPFLADDPVDGGEVVPLDRIGTRSWDSVLADADDPRLSEWASARWLGRWRRLEAVPATFPQTRRSLQAVAEHVIYVARYDATAKIGLRYTHRGFGTPYFAGDRQVRVEAGRLVDTDGTSERRTPITSLRDAAAFVGVTPGPPADLFVASTPLDLDAALPVDEASALALGDWYGFCASVLEQARADIGDGVGRLQLWPEHFDLAFDGGDEAAGRRANFGGSPGDSAHPGPYLYVGPWAGAGSDTFWNEPFGASLSYDELLSADDQRSTALAFFERARRTLEVAS